MQRHCPQRTDLTGYLTCYAAKLPHPAAAGRTGNSLTLCDNYHRHLRGASGQILMAANTLRDRTASGGNPAIFQFAIATGRSVVDQAPTPIPMA
jgi:hypothetical protein